MKNKNHIFVYNYIKKKLKLLTSFDCLSQILCQFLYIVTLITTKLHQRNPLIPIRHLELQDRVPDKYNRNKPILNHEKADQAKR